MKTYHLSPAGRRLTLVLLIGACAIWGFALWSFQNTLGMSYNPLIFWPTLSASIEQGLTISQIVPALLMLVLIVATPLLVWNLLEEWSARYTPTAEGLQFEALGVRVVYPWHAIHALRTIDADSDDAIDELVIDGDYTRQIGNPLLRFLHAQAYGRHTLPLYPGLEGRDELLAEIRQQAPLVEASDTVGSGAQV